MDVECGVSWKWLLPTGVAWSILSIIKTSSGDHRSVLLDVCSPEMNKTKDWGVCRTGDSSTPMGTTNRGVPRSRSAGGALGRPDSSSSLGSQDQGYGSSVQEDGDSPLALDAVMLHRIAFTVWHTALYLQAQVYINITISSHQVCKYWDIRYSWFCYQELTFPNESRRRNELISGFKTETYFGVKNLVKIIFISLYFKTATFHTVEVFENLQFPQIFNKHYFRYINKPFLFTNNSSSHYAQHMCCNYSLKIPYFAIICIVMKSIDHNSSWKPISRLDSFFH
jgi:hypothetical protein